MTDRELMQMALDALEHGLPIIEDFGGKEQLQLQHKAIAVLYEALRARLEQPEPEPVATLFGSLPVYDVPQAEPVAYDVDGATVYIKPPVHNGKYLTGYAAPPQREWQRLTDEEILEEYRQSYGDDGDLTDVYFARAIEAKLKEKNHG